MEYNLNDNINILYNYCYNKNNTDCLNFEKIDLGSININNIKLSLEHVKYNIILQQIIKGKFKNMMIENNNYYYKEYSHDFPITYKISFYKDQKEIYDLSSNINNDSLFSYLLSTLILSKKTKHILLPLLNIDINYNDIEFIFDDNIKYKLKNKIKSNEILNICSVQIKEHYYKQILLNEYLKTNICDYKILLFQIIYTLAVIQNEYPTFRHNNLILNNIFIYCKNKSDIVNNYNGFQNDIFYVPNNGFDIKIYNFENATINKYYGNSIYNPYYDIYILFKDFLNNIKCSDDIISFIKKYIPEKFNENEIIIKPIDLLYDNFFSEYIKINSKEDSKMNSKEAGKMNSKGASKMNSKEAGKMNSKEAGKMISKGDSKMNSKLLQISMDSDNYSILGKQNKLISKSNIIMGKRLIKSDFINTEMSESTVESTSYNTRFLKKNDLSGGALTSYINPQRHKNNPFLSNDNREVFKKQQEETQIREPILVEQTIYQPKQQKIPFQPPPAYLPVFNPDNSLSNKILPAPFSNYLVQPPIQNTYNMNLPSILGSYNAINKIYEDVLPPKYQFAATTINQRLQLINYLRNTMIRERNGEELIQKTHMERENTLLSYIKILKLNPYSIKHNVYSDLPLDFFIFNAGYPIRVNPQTKSIELGKESMGLNVRIYYMSAADYKYKNTYDEIVDRPMCNVWRELKYYDWIKLNIIEKKVSPNFIIPILYKIDSQSKIRWNETRTIKKKELKQETFDKLLTLYGRKKPDPNETDKTENSDSGRSLILLTEAPTNNIIQWSSKIYNKIGTVYQLISSGHHNNDVWKSILFQIMYIFTVLQENEINLSSITLEDNFYVKDLLVDSNNIGSWIYNINGIDYYVPNYGYIVLFDSKFTDINLSSSLWNAGMPTQKKYKINCVNIYGLGLNDNDQYIDDDHVWDQCKEILSTNTLNHSFKMKGGSPPEQTLVTYIENTITNSPDKKIKDLFIKCFRVYLHNKIGKPLTKSEVEKKGALIARSSASLKKSMLFIMRDNTDNLFKWGIITKDKEELLKLQHEAQAKVDAYIGPVPLALQTALQDARINVLHNNIEGMYHISTGIEELIGVQIWTYLDKIIPDQTADGLKFDENYIFEKYYI